MIIPVTITPPAPPTPGARDLGERLAKTIEEFQRSHLHLSTAEIRQALKLAQEDGGASDSRRALGADYHRGSGSGARPGRSREANALTQRALRL